ncbi:hypothetical protein AV530_010030 [Patagioenas fasciata monilis]|uniref:Uncharacterized protein n=1 Tax=Patagioenas fasciata monilis TaxID=372326 RepID=A0A1V4KD85_PATFA|nr:hypothetical protein AV530_010030 [Patagioenas fasciata monilis]
MNESFRELSTPWAQVYDMAETLMQHVPGPHRRIPVMLGQMRSFIARRVKDNAASLQPGAPRDFIDCFLQQMEKVGRPLCTEFTCAKLQMLLCTWGDLLHLGVLLCAWVDLLHARGGACNLEGITCTLGCSFAHRVLLFTHIP